MPDIPGPRGVPLLGMLPALARDPLSTCLTATATYGDVVRLPVLAGSVHLLTHPDHVARVLTTNNRNYWKGRLFRRADFLFGDGLVLNDGDGWHQQRHLMQPGFSEQRLAAVLPALEGVIDRRAARWHDVRRSGGTVEMEAEMTSLTLDLMATAMLGTRLSDDDLHSIGRAFGTVLHHLGLRFATFTLPERVPIPGERNARRALAVLDGAVDRIVAAHPDESDDLLGLLITAHREGRLSRSLLRDEVITLLFGGFEATAHSLAWTWYELDRHPEAAARVRAGGDDTYTSHVIDEVLRLYPPFWEVLRSSYDDDTFGEHTIPGGASVLLVPWVTHRLAEFWKDPLDFRPERWADGRPAHRHAYFPFAAGQRQCIGKPLALLEMRLAVSRLAQEFRPRLVPGAKVEVRAQSTLRSRRGIPMTLT